MGSASAENAKYLDSMQGRIDSMVASFQAMSTSAMDSGFLKGGISAITALIDGFTKLIDTAGVLPTILGGVTAGFSVFNKGLVTVDKANTSLKVFGKNIGEIKDIFTAFRIGGKNVGFDKMFDNRENPFTDLSKRMDNDAKAFERYQEVLQKYKDSAVPQVEIDNTLKGSSDSLKEYIRNTQDAELSFSEFSDSQKRAFVELQASTGGFKSAYSIIKEYNGGLKNVQMSQEDYVKAVSAGNSVLGKHLSGVEMGSASLVRYGVSLVGATAKTVALTAASTVLNTVLTMGIGVLVGAAVGAIDKWIHAEENLVKKTKEVSDEFSEQRSSLMKSKSEYDSAVGTYDKFSKGVNSLGQNIGLTADEFEQYKQAANSIADVTPDMVAGFDAEGNAILKTSANVDTLTEAYNKLIVAQADALLEPDPENDYGGAADIASDYANAMKKWKETADFDISENMQLDELLNSSDIEKSMKDLSDADVLDIAGKFEDMGFEFKSDSFAPGMDEYRDYVVDTIRKNKSEISTAVNEMSAEFEADADKLDNMAMAMLDKQLYGDESLSKMSDSVKNMLLRHVEGFDQEFYQNLIDKNGGDASKVNEYLDAYINDVTSKFKNMGESGQKTLQEAFDFQLDFNAGNISMDEFASKAKELDKVFDSIGLTKEQKQEFMVQLGFEYDDKGLKNVTKDFEEAQKRFSEFENKDAINKWLRGLNGDELDIVANLELEGDETIDELEHLLQLEKALNGIGAIDIAFETESLSKLNAAIKESNGEMGLSQDSIDGVISRYSNLEGFDASAVFNKTTTGIKLNEDALRSLEKQYIATNKKANDTNISVLTEQYKRLTDEIERAKKAGDTDLADSLIADRDVISEEIEKAQMLSAAYDGMTSAYKRWIDSKSGGEEGDMYDSVLAEKKNIQELAKQGLWGRNDLQSYADMFFADGSTDDWDTADYAANWGHVVESMNRYLGEGRGYVDNFINDIKDEFMTVNENDELELKPGVNIEDIANAKNLSTSFVEMMLGKANDYSYNFKIGVDQKSVDDLIAESDAAAAKAQDALKENFGEDFVLDYTVNVNDDGTNDAEAKLAKLKAQRDEINNSDATVEVKQQGLEAVDSAIESVIAQKIALEQPAFMKIDASQVSADMRGAYDKAVELQTAINNLNALKLNPTISADDSQIVSAKQKVDELASTIANSPELKVKLGLDDNISKDDVIAKFQNDEIKIPTSADTTQAASDIANMQDNSKVTVDVTIQGQEKIDGLKAKIDSLKDKTVKVTASAEQNGSIATVKASMDSVKDKNVSVTVNPSGLVPTTALAAAVNAIKDKTVSVVAAPSSDKVNALKSAIDAVVDKTVEVKAIVSGRELVTLLKNEIAATNSKTINITTYKTTIKSEKSEANGTAHVNGTAFADGSKKFRTGDWGTKDSGTALMGELGQEIIVRDGKFFTVGDNGAEFVKYKRGDIIFNHVQSKELLENGYVTSGGGRGRAYVEGTAFASVTGGGKPIPGWGYNYNVSSGNSKSTKSSKSSKSSDSKASEEAEKFEEVLDWIAIAIDRIEREIKNLDTVASSTFRGWSERTEALNEQIAQTRNEIDLQQRAYDRYMKAANDVGLDAGWAQKVRDGKVDVELITDENVADKVKQYQEWYEKALDARDAVIELTEAESQLFQQRFDNVSEKFDGYLGVIEHEKNMLDEFISQSEARGYITSQKYYEALSKNTNDRISELKKQRDEMTAEMNAAVDSGAIEKYSQSWYEMVNAIDDVTLEIESANTELLEFKKTMRELDWEVFELIQDRISGITEESDFLIDLMSNKKLYDDKGQLTDEGQASMGLHGVNYNVYMAQADEYAKKVAELNAQIAKDPYNQDLINKRDEYLEAQRESILNAEDEKDAIRDMVEEGINLELDALQELIDRRNDAIDSAKELYDRNKRIAEATKEIAELEKQLGAYATDSSEEAKATIQELKVQLEESRGDLEDELYDQYIADQQKLLDTLYDEYSLILNTRLDSIDALVQQQIDYINQNAATINQTLIDQATAVGTQLSGEMKNIWNTSNVDTNGDKIKNVIDFYGRDFGSKLTTVNSTINNVVVGVNNMIAKLDAIAQQKANQAASSSASKPNPNNGNANNKPSTPNPSPAPAKPKADAYGIAGSIWTITNNGWGNDPVRSGKLTEAYGADFARQVQSIINSTFATGRWDIKRDYSPYTSYRLLGYATGKHNIESDRYAWTQEQGSEMIVRPSDGAVLTPLAKGDSVLNASASSNIWDMANNPADFIKSNLGSSANGIPSSSAGSNITQNIENVTFSMPNVKNYDQLIRAMQKDRNFERLVLSMSVDRLAGGSSLAKGKAVK